MKKRIFLIGLFAALAISSTIIGCIFSSKDDECACTEITYGYDNFGFRYTASSQGITCTSELKNMSKSGGATSKYEYDGIGRLIKEQTISCK